MAKEMPLTKKYGYLWVTLGFFVISLLGHWLFAWPAYVQEQQEHHEAARFAGYFMQTARDTFENWQSEFLQLIWQVAGLRYLLYVGSPQSKEGDERIEAKIDHLLKKVDPQHADEVSRRIEGRYPQK